MFIKRPEQVEALAMQMHGARQVRMRLMIGRQDGAPHFAMRLFEVAPGGHTPLHEHNYEHEVLILDGQGQLVQSESDDDKSPLVAGDVVFIAAKERHQFRNPYDRPLKFLCMIPTQFNCAADPCTMTATPGS